MTSLHRRRFLRLGGAATAVALGGCLGMTNGSPSYAEWLPAPDGGVNVAYLDFSIASETAGGDELLPLILPADTAGGADRVLTDVSGFDSVDDPLLSWPLAVGGRLVAGAALAIAVSGFGPLIDPEQPDRGIGELFMAGNVAIGLGEFDRSEAAETLRSGSAGPVGDVPFEETGSIGSFTLYAPPGEELDGVTAINDTAVVVADTREEIRRVVETANGDRASAIEHSETLTWLLETAGTGHVAGGWLGPVDLDDAYFGEPADRPVTDLIRPTDDVLASVTFEPDTGHIRADFAVQRSLDDEVASQFDARFGSASETHSVSIDGDRVTASGTYSEGVLDFEVIQPDRTTTATPDTSAPVDPPEAVATAVPDEAFAFTYEADQERVRVGITKPLDVDEVAFEAVESGYEASTTTPRADMYLYLYVDPDGDTVVVTATVDGTSGVVARRAVP
ncbi:hypothetical protein Hrd1104_11010 [Halorhabdus sp. CBA1104]|uniref:hypothetical protein n=1 Tax=Halorhabdus sp. CBA1104 TaxID=1380432 RepID=UPI0012B3F88A|nr:hypothetical protein [Halorhabdus sp. CBA1104]QGN07775.1 hypothetical protein Hrd1104_11010 [Halorhabdus sp. CBA1104]